MLEEKDKKEVDTASEEKQELKGFKGLVVQFIKFGFVGVLNTIVSGGLFFILNNLAMPGHYILSNIISWVVSVFHAFVWQDVFVFKESKDKEHRVWWKTLLKTYMAYASTGLILNNILLWLWTDVIDIAQYSAGMMDMFAHLHIGFLADPATFSSNMGWVINMLISIPLNFIINKFWAYRQK